MVNFPTRIHDCDSHSPDLFHLFVSSDTNVSSTMTFLPLGNSGHIVVSVFINFPSNAKGNVPFHLPDYLRDVSWKDFLKLETSAAFSKFCEWIKINTDVYISHRKYQVKPHSSQ